MRASPPASKTPWSSSATTGIEFRLKKLELREPDGDLVASAPLASAAISTTDLFKLRITPKRVFLIEPRVFLFYSDEGGLALSFSGEEGGDRNIIPPAPVPAKRPNGSVIAKTTQASERIDLARKLVELNDRAQRGLSASYKLREIGLQDASVVLVFAGQTSEWRVPSFVIDLDRKKTGSTISGTGRIDSGQGEWSFGFRTEEARADSAVKLKVEVADFLPPTLGKVVPRLSLLNTLDMRVAGHGSIDLKANGDVAEAKLELAFGEGNIKLPDVAQPLAIENGSIGLAFDGASRQLTVLPSTLKWGQSYLSVVGSAKQTGDAATGDTEWQYAISSKEGVLAAEDLGVAPDQGRCAAGEGPRHSQDRPHRDRAGAVAGRRRSSLRTGRDHIRRCRLQHAHQRHDRRPQARYRQDAVAVGLCSRRPSMGRHQAVRRCPKRHDQVRQRRFSLPGRCCRARHDAAHDVRAGGDAAEGQGARRRSPDDRRARVDPR